MADVVQNVIVDFQVDYSQLTSAQEQLAKGGKIDTSQFTALSKAISSTATDTKGLIQDFKKVAGTAISMGKSVEDAFGAGIQDALDEAGVSMEEFSDALAKANTPAKSLKAELRELKLSLAQAKLEGKDTGAEFNALRDRAGELSDAIADAGAEIKNAGSDTRNIDNVVGSISALAGGFAAAQGAAALFGGENEDVQKALLKVNAAMAIAAGVQQFYNATLKEGSIAKLADSIATGSQSAATTLYTFVTGGATVATKAFRAALLATGIGAIVVLVIALVNALDDTAESLESVNKGIERQNELLESSNNLLQKQADVRLATAKAAGAAESELLKIQALSAKAQYDNTVKTTASLIKQRDATDATSAQWFALNEQIEKNGETQSDLARQIEILNIQGRAQIKQETEDKVKGAQDAAKKQKEIADKSAKEARERRLAELNDLLAFIQRDLLSAQKGSEVELDLKKKEIRAKRDIELEGEKLTKNQVSLIKAQAVKEQQDLNKAFIAKATEDQLKAQIDINNAQLAGIALGAEERLRLQIETLDATAKLEINAANGNTAKILAIEADKQAKIRALKNAAIDQQLADELASVAVVNKIVTDALQKQSVDYTKSKDARISALRAIENIELTAVDKAIEANKKKLQSDEDYQRKYKELQDKKALINAETNQKIADDDEKESKDKEDRLIKTAQNYISVANQVADFYSSLSALATEKERQRIDDQKKQLQSLVEAGAITEKAAKIRAKEIEIAEKKTRQAQAQREKQAAVFKAVLAIPTAFLSGLSQGGIYLAAVYAALAAAQAAIVISKPVPKFFRGKKDNYEGLGVVADMGSELVERDGRMYLYTKPTETFIGARDKVYTAAETRQIMHSSNINTTIAPAVQQQGLDYKKLANAIPKSSFSISIEKDFIEESVSKGLSKTRVFNNRYSKWQ